MQNFSGRRQRYFHFLIQILTIRFQFNDGTMFHVTISKFCNKYIAIDSVNLKSYFLWKIETFLLYLHLWSDRFTKPLSVNCRPVHICVLLRLFFRSSAHLDNLFKNAAVGIRFSNFRIAFIKGKKFCILQGRKYLPRNESHNFALLQNKGGVMCIFIITAFFPSSLK